MLANGGNTGGLFSGAVMESGSPSSVGDLSVGQNTYDSIVNAAGCSHANDTLDCLRHVPLATLQAAVDQVPSLFDETVRLSCVPDVLAIERTFESLALRFQPRVDGVLLTDNPQHLVARGQVADVPFINGELPDSFPTLESLYYLTHTKGDCDDEGT